MSESNSADRKRSNLLAKTADGESPSATLGALDQYLREATLEVLWRQWAAIGGAVSVTRRAASLVDPEALVLGSLSLVHEEPRLTDVMADWLALNSDLLSVQRMRNLARGYPRDVQARLGEAARIALVEGKDHRWKVLTSKARGTSDDFPRRGNKRRAVRVRVTEPASLMLRLRLALGVSIKADVLTMLLSADPGQWASVSALVLATGYTVAAVRKAIRDLAEARLIDSMVGTRTEYRAVRSRWQALLGVSALPQWRDWGERFRFGADFSEWVKNAKERPLTSYVVESRWRDLIAAHSAAFRWGTDDADWADRVVTGDENALVPAIARLGSWMETNA